MQVASPEKQKDVMIEAVENHTPEVIVVDEIGTEHRSPCSKNNCRKRLMLIATAHGNVTGKSHQKPNFIRSCWWSKHRNS